MWYDSAPLLLVPGTGTLVLPVGWLYWDHSTGTVVTIQLNDGAIGQELFFVYSEAQTGLITIQGASTPLVLPGGTKIDLDAQGKTAHLLCVDDGTGNGVWFLVGGTGYTIS